MASQYFRPEDLTVARYFCFNYYLFLFDWIIYALETYSFVQIVDVKSQVDETKSIMMMSIDNILSRGEKLEGLDEKKGMHSYDILPTTRSSTSSVSHAQFASPNLLSPLLLVMNKTITIFAGALQDTSAAFKKSTANTVTQYNAPSFASNNNNNNESKKREKSFNTSELRASAGPYVSAQYIGKQVTAGTGGEYRRVVTATGMHTLPLISLLAPTSHLFHPFCLPLTHKFSLIPLQIHRPCSFLRTLPSYARPRHAGL